MLRLALRSVSTRKARFAGSLLAIALAVTVITAGGVLLQSALTGDRGSPRFDAVTLIVTGNSHLPVASVNGQAIDAGADPVGDGLPPPRLPLAVAKRVAQVSGVREVVPDVSVYSQVVKVGEPSSIVNADGAMRGHGWSSSRLTPYRLRDGHPPVSPDEIVLDGRFAARKGLGTGDSADVVTAVDGTRRYRVVGVADPATPGPSHATAVFFTDQTAARLSGDPTRVDAIAVFAESHEDVTRLASRVRDAAGDGTLVLTDTSQAEPSADSGAYVATTAFLGIMSAVAGFVAIFVVAGTFSLLVVQRRRETAVLRAVGATGGQVRRMIAAEALVVSAIALAVGVPAGLMLSRPLASLLVTLGVAPTGFHPVYGAVPVIVAAVAGIGLTQLAAFTAAGRAARVRPTEALRESAAPPRRLSRLRTLAGFAFAALSAFIVANGIATGGNKGSGDVFVVSFTLMVTATLLGPMVTARVARLVAPLIAVLGRGQGFLAAANSKANPWRIASASTPITLAVTFTCIMIFMPQTVQKLTLRESQLRIQADHVLVSADGQGLPSAVTRDVARLPGVSAVAATTPIPVRLGMGGAGGPVPTRTLMALAVVPAQVTALLDLDVKVGRLSALTDDGIAASSAAAREHGWRVGDRLPVGLPDGTRRELHLVATYDRSLGLSDVLVPADLAARHAPQALATAIYVKGETAEGLNALTKTHPTLITLSRSAYLAQMKQSSDAQTTAVYLFIMLIGLYTAISVMNMLAAATAARAREFAALRLAGSTRRQVLTMVGGEALITVAVGVFLGTLIAATTLVSSSLALTRTPVFAAPPQVYLTIVATAVVLGLAATLFPAGMAVRLRAISVIGARE
ncbi:ABC transporter permease [Planotetraspora silvatica]|uniref:ABC transporter permease n=1 Tax=Planotetraspora silvatica TaxID=234614 RepID=A0A8J3UH28_9ACTN|nr:FtsX-like permease family protein [Planotetraspora silvatica]GII45173.1 ABC transporter permease [Planotetraspora silvatica]